MNGELSQQEREVLNASGTALLKRVGLGDDLRFERLSGGRNNRVYRVTAGDKSAVLKWYFRHANDQRDRLNAEFAFCEYARECGASCVATPLGRDDASQLAVFSLIEGHRLTKGEVDTGHNDQALAFLRDLNDRNSLTLAESLPVASEACFSLDEHLTCINARVGRLIEIVPRTECHREAMFLTRKELVPALLQSQNRLEKWARASSVSMSDPSPTEQRCVSPSDFGFHNALIGERGRLSFFDFEYAGWDDPAKLLCDFYCQPEVPAPRETWQAFADLTAELAGDTPLERQRQALLFPLYQVKWCCILLNEFVPTASERRKFSGQKPVDLALQLEKAKRLAAQLLQEIDL
jgi:thiamine kinase-like enzyme